jgi:hypothetical protein
LLIVVALILLMASRLEAADDIPPTYLQAFLGAAQFDNDSVTFLKSSADDSTKETSNDLSTMPYLGIGGQYAFSDASSHIGLDATLLIGWRSRSSSIAAANGQARISLDAELWLLDLATGFYAQTILGQRWRIYGAAGPLMLFGQYSEDTEEDNEDSSSEAVKDSSTDSGFGVGGYARVGLEYRLANGSFMGLCGRGIKTDMSFDSSIDNGNLNGFQGFITYSQPFWKVELFGITG